MRTHIALALTCACTLLAGTAWATPTDFHRNIHGNLYQGGNLSGSFDYEFHYNTVDSHVGIIAPTDPVYVQAYAPFSGFANQFFANLTVYNTGGTQIQQALDMSIYRFLVINNVESTPGQPHDAFEIDTHSAYGDIQMIFFTLNASTLSDTSLNSILIQDTPSDIMAPANGSLLPMAGSATLWQFGFGQSSTVSGPIPDIPTPGTLPLVALSLGALAWTGRRSRAQAQQLPAH